MTQDHNPESNTQPSDAGEELAPEVRERVEQLMRGLNEAPAITCPFTFNWHGNQELADRASIKIRLYGLMMREDWPSMSFDALKAITFHHDYEQALKDAVGAEGAAPAPTKEAGGFSVGMMVRVPDGVHLVMHESVALALASEEQEQSDWGQHIVRHELCHVADFAFKRDLIARYPDKCTYSGFESFMAPLAEALWDEFYANTYSSGSWSDPRTFLDLLRDAVLAIHAEIVDAILDYRSSADLDGLLAIAAPKVKFIAQCFGYAAGTLAALGVSLEQEAPEEHAMLQRLGLLDAWDECFRALGELDRAHPNWESVLDLSKLFPGCLALFAGFGLHYRPQGEGAYVDIPSTPETSPAQAMLRRLGVR
jgi:hypothetical protein